MTSSCDAEQSGSKIVPDARQLRAARSRLAVQRRPAVMIEEEAHAADVPRLAQIEPVVRASRDDDQIAGVDFDAHPLVARVPNIENARAVDDEPNLVEGVVMLLIEFRADGVEVGSLRRERHLVLVDVAALALDALDLHLAAGQRKAPMKDSEPAQVVSASFARRTASMTIPAELGESQTSSLSSAFSGTSPNARPSMRMYAHFLSVSQGT